MPISTRSTASSTSSLRETRFTARGKLRDFPCTPRGTPRAANLTMLRSLALVAVLASAGCIVDHGASQYEGHYEGSYSGSDFGTLTLQVAANGDITLDATSNFLGAHYHGTGAIDRDGHGTASTGTGFGVGISFAFSGSFDPGHPVKASGTGRWTATRQE
jgi:hypothetical protein